MLMDNFLHRLCSKGHEAKHFALSEGHHFSCRSVTFSTHIIVLISWNQARKSNKQNCEQFFILNDFTVPNFLQFVAYFYVTNLSITEIDFLFKLTNFI